MVTPYDCSLCEIVEVGIRTLPLEVSPRKRRLQEWVRYINMSKLIEDHQISRSINPRGNASGTQLGPPSLQCPHCLLSIRTAFCVENTNVRTLTALSKNIPHRLRTIYEFSPQETSHRPMDSTPVYPHLSWSPSHKCQSFHIRQNSQIHEPFRP